MARFSLEEYKGRKLTPEFMKELEEGIKMYLFQEGCYGSAAVANVLIELVFGIFGTFESAGVIRTNLEKKK